MGVSPFLARLNEGRVLVAAGANVVGGCCGTSPERLQHIAKAVK